MYKYHIIGRDGSKLGEVTASCAREAYNLAKIYWPDKIIKAHLIMS